MSRQTKSACYPVAVLICATVSAAKTPVPAPDADLAYRFELVREPQLEVRVELSVRGDSSGTTAFEVSRSWGGVDVGGEDLVDFLVHDDKGGPLTAEHPEPHRWVVHHAQGGRLTASYAFAANQNQKDTSPDVHRRTILNAGLLHFYGELGLVRPADWDEEVKRRVVCEWHGFDAAGWHIAHSFGVGGEASRFEATLTELRETIILAGPVDLLQRDVRGGKLWIAIQGERWGFAHEAFADLAARIVDSERAFFDDPGEPYYLITVIETGEPDPRSRSVGGTGLTQSFSLCMQAGTTLDAGGGTGGIAHLLAHEMLHHWNGHVIARRDPEELVYWFSEGFTDFFARRILLRAGLMDLDEYADSVSRKWVDLLTSEAREAPNQRIREAFWTEKAVQRLPYVRGDVVAMLVDRAIRRASKGARSLDDVVRDLVREGRAGTRIDTESLLARFARETSPGFAAEIGAIVDGGIVPVASQDLFGPCLDLQMETVPRFDLGFDFDRSQQEKTITGVRPGSAADAAGLRDGQSLAGWSVQSGRTDRQAIIRVRDGEQTREITYWPRGAGIEAPRFRPSSSADPSCPGL